MHTSPTLLIVEKDIAIRRTLEVCLSDLDCASVISEPMEAAAWSRPPALVVARKGLLPAAVNGAVLIAVEPAEGDFATPEEVAAYVQKVLSIAMAMSVRKAA